MLEHGGRLRLAAARYGIPLADWLDLSTGINPNGWPVLALPPSMWVRLPEEEDGLEAAARDYYGAACVLPVAGSQAAIQTLPQLMAPCHVGVIHPGYAEHAHAWQRGGHTVTSVPISNLDSAVAQSDIIVLIHPNNPTGTCFPREQLLRWHKTLAARGGWLIVDEAFMDATPEQSLAPLCPRQGLIVLRSLGKFFGLAGARAGFVCAEPLLLNRLKAQLGPWTVTTPSRWVATRVFADRAWQDATRKQLHINSERLAALLQQHGLTPQGGCALFQWVPTPRTAELHDKLARLGILTRLFEQPASLRFGLPGTETDWIRLEATLTDVCEPALAGTCA
ncbi:MAG: threonine-phosphate decarboxylase [Gammaproteobacteria bacterium]|nr:threonine-phosphate decarboxylase [Gammaproteobacteria bacterium]